MDQDRRRELKDAYRVNRPAAGVYRIVNKVSGRYLLGSTANLPNIENKLSFVRATGTFGVLERRIRRDVEAHGIDAFSVEVLEVLDGDPSVTEKEIADDLSILESLWREKLDTDLAY